MNIRKLEEELDIMPISSVSNAVIKQDTITDLIPVEEDAVILYTTNPELQKEIDLYKQDRQNSIEILRTARQNIAAIATAQVRALELSTDARDIDAFAKLNNTLVAVIDKLDEITSPSKVELYINPPDTEEDDSETEESNPGITNNIIMTNPAELLRLMRGEQINESNNT